VRMRGAPLSLAHNALMNKLYVACFDDCMVRVYDCSADTLVAEVSLGTGHEPFSVLWNPSSNRVFCLTGYAYYQDSVFVIDCATDAVVERLFTGEEVHRSMCTDPVSGAVYVGGQNALYALTPGGDSLVAEIGGFVTSFCAAPFPRKLYAVLGSSLCVIDCETFEVKKSFEVPTALVICDTRKAKVYAVSSTDLVLNVFDARADSLVLALPLPDARVQAAAWNSTRSRVYLATLDSAVQVIRDTAAGIEEGMGLTASQSHPLATVVHGVLFFGASGEGRQASGVLLDISGRTVAELRPGQNDVSHLPTGVYFIRERSAVGGERSAASVRKVVSTE
jgi:DNA-binding beta-propeller fold protein YncE